MERLGHSSPRAALIYQHATRNRDRAIALDTLARKRRDAPGKSDDDGGDLPLVGSRTGTPGKSAPESMTPRSPEYWL